MIWTHVAWMLSEKYYLFKFKAETNCSFILPSSLLQHLGNAHWENNETVRVLNELEGEYGIEGLPFLIGESVLSLPLKLLDYLLLLALDLHIQVSLQLVSTNIFLYYSCFLHPVFCSSFLSHFLYWVFYHQNDFQDLQPGKVFWGLEKIQLQFY